MASFLPLRALPKPWVGLILVIVSIVSVALPSHTSAAVGINSKLNYQGRLLNAAGAVVADGFYNLEFKIYQDGPGNVAGDTGGTLKWYEDYVYATNAPDSRVQVKNGYFSVSLGNLCPLSGGTCTSSTGNAQSNAGIDFNQDTLWLSINIGNTSTAATFAGASGDGEMLPMRRLSANPYALNSGKVGGLAASQLVRNDQGNTLTGTQVFQNAANNSILTVNATSNQIELGKPSTLNGTVVINNATNANTVTLTVGATAASYALTLPLNAPALSQCLQNDATTIGQLTFAACGSGGSNLQGAYTGSTGGAVPEIKLDATRGALDIQDADTSIAGNLLAVHASNGAGLGTALFTVDSSGFISLQPSTVTGAGLITGGQTHITQTTNIGGTTAGTSRSYQLNSTITNATNPTTNIGHEINQTDNATALANTNYGINITEGGTNSSQTAYAGYFNLGSAAGTAGSAIFGTNGTRASNILQLQDSGTDVFKIADQGLLLHSPIFNPSGGGTQTAQTITIVNAPTSTANTAVGSSLVLSDSTALANTLQGVKIAVSDTGTGVKSVQGLIVDTTGSTNLTSTVTTALFKTASSKTGFQIQGAGGSTILEIGTISGTNLLNEGNFEGTAAATGSWIGLNTPTSIATSADATFMKFGTQSLKVVTGAVANRGAKYIYPFKPNTTYTFSAYADVSTGTMSTFDIGANVNASDVTCNVSGNAKTLTTSPTRFSCTFTTGATVLNGTDYVFLRNSSATGYTMYFDGTQLELGSSTSPYTEPAAPNLIGNPSFESGTNGWTAKGSGTVISTDQTSIQSGRQALKIATTTTANAGASFNVPLAANTLYTLSGYARLDTGTSADFDIGRQDNGSDVTCLTGQALNTTYTRFNCTFTTGGTVNSTTNIFFQKSGASAENIFLDAVQLERASSASQFNETFDNLHVDALSNTITLNGNNSGEIGLWQLSANSLPAVRAQASYVSANGYVYIVNGTNGVGAQSGSYYAKLNADGSVGTWSATTSPPARYGATSVVANGYIYGIGGNSGGAINTVYFAKLNTDGTIGTWNSTTSLPAARDIATSVVANGYIYEIGGSSASTVYYARLNADGSVGTWNTNSYAIGCTTPGCGSPIARFNSTSVVANGYVYVIAGNNASTVYYAKLNSDGSTGAWTTNANALPSGRGKHTSAIANGYVYVIGGDNPSNNPQTTVYFAKLNSDGSTGVWQTSQNSLPDARDNAATIVANGYLYEIGGYNTAATAQNNTYYASFERVLIGASLDLVGLSSQTLNEQGGTGGTLTAGNTSIIGTLDVRDQTSFSQGVGINGVLSVGGAFAVQPTFSPSTGGAYTGSVLSVVNSPTTLADTASGQAITLTDTASLANALTGQSVLVTESGAGSKTIIGQSATISSAGSGAANITGQAITVIDTGTGAKTIQGFVVDTTGITNINAGSNNTTALFKASNSKTGFQIQGPTGATIADINTTSPKNLLNEGNFEGGAAATGGWTGLNSPTSIATSADATYMQFGAQSLKVVTGAVANRGAKYIYPFKPNTTYTFSAYADVSTSTMSTFDIGANVNSSDVSCVVSGNGNTLTTAPTRFSCTFTTGATVQNGTDYVFLRNSSATSYTMYFDGTQLELGSSTSAYTEPAAANLIGNPSFESGTNGWTAKGSGTVISTDQTYFQSGRQALKLTTTTTANAGASFNVPLLANTPYTLSGYARLDTGTSSDFVVGRQDNGSDNTCLTAQNLNTTYTRFTCTFTTGGTVNTTTNIFFQKSGVSAENIFLDAVQLERSSSASQYVEAFDNLHVDALSNTITLNGNNSGEISPWQLNANALPGIRQSATSVVANGYVYEIGGIGNLGVYQSTVYYAKLNADGTTGAWQTSANSLPTARSYATSVVANGYVYEIGGNNGITYQATVYYAKLNADGSTGAWQTSSNALPTIRGNATSVVANGYVYEIGGYNSTTYQATVYYAKLNADGSTGAWQTSSNALPTIRGNATSVVANGYVYEIGGVDNTPTAQSTVLYAKLNADGSTGAWQNYSGGVSPVNPLPAIRGYATSIVANGYVYEIGGYNLTTMQSTVYYAKLNADGSTGAWQTSSNALPDLRGYGTSVVANGYVYEIGGFNSTTKQSTVYYTSTARILAGGSLDLVGLGGQLLGDVGGTGGSITAADGTFVGNLQVQGQVNLNQGAAVNGDLAVGGTVNVRPAVDSKTGFEIQSQAGGVIADINTTSYLNLLNEGNFEGGASATGGWAGLNTPTSIATSTDATFMQFGAQSLKVVTGAVANRGAQYVFPFAPNTTYTFSAYAALSTSTMSTFDIGAKVNGSDVACTVSGIGKTLTTIPTRYSCTFTTGATVVNGTDYLYLRNSSATGYTMYFDGTQLELGSNMSAYTEPAATNLIGNPSFEQGTNGWTAKGSGTVISTDQTYIQSGRQALKIATTTTANAGVRFSVPLAANTLYTLSGYARLDTGTSADFDIGRQDNGSDNTCLTAQALSSTYTRFSCTFTTGGTVNDTPNIFFQKSGASAENIYLDAVQLERTSNASQFNETYDNLHVDALSNIITLNGNNSGEISPWQLNANALPAVRWQSTSVVANGYVYEIGGYNGPAQSTVYYAKLNSDGSVGAWSTATNALPAIRASATSVVANGYVYLLGGYDGTSNQSTVYYAKLNSDGSVGAWTTSNNALPVAQRNATSVVANNYIYEIAGGGGTSTIIYYARLNADGSIGSWNTASNSLPSPRYNATSVVANGYVYVIGGNNGGSQSTIFYAKLNPDGSVGAWNTANNALPSGRDSATSVVSNGYIYEIGGTSNSGSNYLSTVYYSKLNVDGSVGSWSTANNSLPGGRYYATSVMANGYIYEIGGYNSTVQTAVYYTSTARILAGGSLDLVGLGGQTLNEQGGTGGTLTAGNTTIVGTFDVRDQANFSQNVGIGGALTVNGSAAIKATQNSTNILQVQNGSGTNVLNLSTINLIANGDFEIATPGAAQTPDGWALKNSSTISVENTIALFGTRSQKVVTTTTANGGTSYNFSFLPSTQYTLSGYAAMSAGSITDFVVGRQENSSDSTCLTAQTVTTTWTRFSCTFTTGATIGTSNIFFQKSGASAETFFIDGVQLELAASASSYRNGDISLQGATSITGSLQLQPSTDTGVGSLTGGQTHITQTSNVGGSTAGTTRGYLLNSTITNATNATTNNGFEINQTDNATALANTNTGIKATAGGTNANQTAYAGYFSLGSASGTAGAALYATNGTRASTILQLQNNGTDVFTVGNGGATTLTGTYLQKSSSASAFIIQNASNENTLVVDGSTKHLKVFENVASPVNYADIYYNNATGTAVFAASAGVTQIGAGTGNVTSNLTGANDLFSFTKTYTPIVAYSINDFTITRALIGAANSLAGSVLTVTDNSTGSASAPNVLYVNQNNASAAGNLILAQTGGGANDKFAVNTLGTVTIASGQSYTSTGAVTLQSAAATALTVDSGTTGAVNIGGSANAKTITIGNATGASSSVIQAGTGGIILKPITSNTAAFTLQDSGTQKFLILDTTNDRLQVGDTAGDTIGVLLVLDTKTDTGDPTGIDGSMYYNSDAKAFRCNKNGLWKDCDVTSLRAEWAMKEEWMQNTVTAGTTFDLGNIGDNLWTFVSIGTGGTLTKTDVGVDASDQGRFGVLQMNSPATVVTGTALRLDSTSMAGVPSNMTVEFDYGPVNAAAAVQTQVTSRIGLLDSTTSATPIDGIYFQYNKTVTAGNWERCTMSNAVSTCTDTGIAATTTANQYQRFKIVTNSAGTQVDFFINEASAGSNTTNLPAAGRSYGPGINMNTVTATIKQYKMDYFQIKRNLTTLR